jgi:phage terminase large subunit GpA-like protein
MTAAPADINTALANLWRPRLKVPCIDWVKKHVWLDRRFTDREGYYDPTFNPYIISLHQWFGDPTIRTITAPKGAQLGLTTWLANAMQWAIVEDPGPILFITSTADNARAWSEREWLRRIDTCRPLKALVPADKDAIKKLDQSFHTCDVALRGAQSENNLSLIHI